MDCSLANTYIAARQVGRHLNSVREVGTEVNGKQVRALVDTGCSATLLQPQSDWPRDGMVKIHCIHGGVKPYATTRIWVTIIGERRRLMVGLVPNML